MTNRNEINEGVKYLVEAVDESFPKELEAGVSVHSFLGLTTEVSECFESSKSKAIGAEYDRLFNEIKAALPADKKHLALRLDETVGKRLCDEELVPLTAGLIAGLLAAGMSKQKAAAIARERLVLLR